MQIKLTVFNLLDCQKLIKCEETNSCAVVGSIQWCNSFERQLDSIYSSFDPASVTDVLTQIINTYLKISMHAY